MTTVPTAAWPADDLGQLGGADEISISTRRPDGSLRPFVPIWIVSVGEALYVRSYRGTGGAWYQHATQHPAGSIRSGDHQADVTFAPADQTQREAIDAPSTPATASPTCPRCSPTRQATRPCTSSHSPEPPTRREEPP